MAKKAAGARRALESVEELRCRVWCLQQSVQALELEAARRLPEAVQRLPDQRKKLAECEDALREREEIIGRWIEKLSNHRWRMVLRYHYLEGMGLMETADAMCKCTGRPFTAAQVYGMHFRALEAAERLWPLHEH